MPPVDITVVAMRRTGLCGSLAAFERVDGLFAPVEPLLGQFTVNAIDNLLCG